MGKKRKRGIHRRQPCSSHREREGVAPRAMHVEGATRAPVIEIVDMAFPNNYGVGKIDNYVLFVPGAVPQDRVRVDVVDHGKQFGYGKIISLEKPSPFRTTPFCPHFGSCGGCTLQNLSYDHQLVIKENYLRQTLKRLGHIDSNTVDMLPIRPSPETFFYRGKIELAFGKHDGQVALGLRERVSPFKRFDASVVPIHECRACSPLIEKIIPVFLDFARTNNLSPYNPIKKEGFLRHIILKESKSTGTLMCILETTAGSLPDMKECLQRLTVEVPEIISFYAAINNSAADVVRYEKIIHMSGKTCIEERLGPFMFHIYPESFFQPNARAAEKLFDSIPDLTALGRDQNLLGLYCGTGTIEILLSRYVRKVTGVDSLPANIANAVANCRTNGVINCTFNTMRVENLRETDVTQKPGILVIDPPRGGLSSEALKVIFKHAPDKIVYISCNPSTLARDLRLLLEKQYVIDKIAPFDFFPHTSHLETVVILHHI